MRTLRVTLVADGPSDGEMLIPILEWLLRTHCGSIGVNVVHADPRRCREAPRRLEKKIAFALEAYPCEFLFIHRDAEGDPADWRRQEIQKSIESLGAKMGVTQGRKDTHRNAIFPRPADQSTSLTRLWRHVSAL